jgi:lysophospholipase L1-like esterase
MAVSKTLIVALGDSTTAGTPGFRSPLEAPPEGAGNIESQYAHWLMLAHPEWHVLNRGVNGERSDQIRTRFARDVLAEHPDLVVIIAGVNDIYQGRSAAAVQTELEAMFESARTSVPSVPVVAGSILPYNTATQKQNDEMKAVNGWLKTYAAVDPNVTFCDTRAAAALPDDINRLISSPDNLHPSPEGYRRVALTLEPVIARALSRAVRKPPRFGEF